MDRNSNLVGLFAGLVLLLSLLLLMLRLAGAGSSPQLQPSTGVSMFKYEVLHGMPCVVYDYESVSCDWTQWDGRVEDGAIVLPEVGR